MKSLRELYRIGLGPSSSHTMGPRLAAEDFKAAYPTAARLRVTLYGTLAATGPGHPTEPAVSPSFSPTPVDILRLPVHSPPPHPNGIQFEALDTDDSVLARLSLIHIWSGLLPCH